MWSAVLTAAVKVLAGLLEQAGKALADRANRREIREVRRAQDEIDVEPRRSGKRIGRSLFKPKDR